MLYPIVAQKTENKYFHFDAAFIPYRMQIGEELCLAIGITLFPETLLLLKLNKGMFLLLKSFRISEILEHQPQAATPWI